MVDDPLASLARRNRLLTWWLAAVTMALIVSWFYVPFVAISRIRTRELVVENSAGVAIATLGSSNGTPLFTMGSPDAGITFKVIANKLPMAEFVNGTARVDITNSTVSAARSGANTTLYAGDNTAGVTAFADDVELQLRAQGGTGEVAIRSGGKAQFVGKVSADTSTVYRVDADGRQHFLENNTE